MELVLGQYNRQGPITVWKVCPLFRGRYFLLFYFYYYFSFIIYLLTYFIYLFINYYYYIYFFLGGCPGEDLNVQCFLKFLFKLVIGTGFQNHREEQ